MKHIYHTMFLLLFPVLLLAQDADFADKMPMKDGQPFFEKIVEMPGVGKKELYRAVSHVMADYYKAKQMSRPDDDDEAGLITGEMRTHSSRRDTNKMIGVRTYIYVSYKINFMVDISVKDGKYRIQLYNHTGDMNITLNSAMTGTTGGEDGRNTDLYPYSFFKQCLDDGAKAPVRKSLREATEQRMKNCRFVLQKMYEESGYALIDIPERVNARLAKTTEDW